jgi:hypothetical protein
MSVLYKDNIRLLLPHERKYGVKPMKDGVVLPIGIKTGEESDKFLQDLSNLGLKTQRLSNSIFSHYGIRKRGCIRIEPSEESIELGSGSYLTWGSDWKIIDTVIRHTLLGKKLEEHWQETEKLSKDESHKKLMELTPLAEQK